MLQLQNWIDKYDSVNLALFNAFHNDYIEMK